MTSATTFAQPGDMTVPLLFGWEGIAVVVTLVIVVGAVAFLALAAGRGAGGRSDWQAWLEARSAPPVDVLNDDGTARQSRPSDDAAQSAYSRK